MPTFAAPPLAGVRVLDLTRLLPGPLASLALADLGATVDKLEDPGMGDYLRHMPPMLDGASGAFRLLNRDKRSIVLDLKHPRGPELLNKMLAHYDVLLESFRPGVLARLGLSHDQLRAQHPRLIICAITGYGQHGPLKHRAGHDLNYLARAGVLGVTGPADGPPAVSAAQMADVAGGSQWAVSAILAALFARERGGQGAVLDLAMCDGSMPLIAFAMGGALADGVGPARGNHHLNGGIAPFATYETSDGKYVSLAALEPKFWETFCAAANIECSLDALMPGDHQPAMRSALRALFLTRTRDEWAAFGAQHDCCVEPVLALSELWSDAQHVARGVFFPLGERMHMHTPLSSPRTHWEARAAGQDTVEILREAGVEADEITSLHRDMVVRSREG